MWEVTLEEAVALLLLPRELGAHPGDGQPVMANTGRCVSGLHHYFVSY